MDARQQIIVETAFQLFAHYGVGKTSMTEIAATAKVARQTLYNAFESKEDLIFAALLHHGRQTKADIERDCAETTELNARLDCLFEHMALRPFEAMQKLPHLDEILEIMDNLSAERRAQLRANYVDGIRIVLAPYGASLAAIGVETAALSDLIKSMFTQIKRDAKDPAELRALFAPLRALIVFSVGQAGAD